MTPARRLLVIADVGRSRHVGDEAMLEANLLGLRAAIPDAVPVVMSRDPAWIAERYDVESVPLFGFPHGDDGQAGRLALDEALQNAAESGSPAGEALEAVRSVDAVIVSGGGNLSSNWPHLLAERVALLKLANQLGKPAVVLGQTIGPRLTSWERAALSAAVSVTRLVGVRELPSAALAASLGVPLSRIWYQCDDAMFIGGLDSSEGVDRETRKTIAVTIDPQFRLRGAARFESLALQLRELAVTTGASIRLAPHEFGDEAPGRASDLTEARLLAETIALPATTIAEGLDARTAARIAADAALVISTRYHPLVFAVAAGTPCVGVYGDDYSRIKLQGALAHGQLSRSAIHYDEAAGGALLPLSLELWRDRENIGRTLRSFRAGWKDEARRRWDAIARALDPGNLEAPDIPGIVLGQPEAEIVPALLAALEAGRGATDRLELRCHEVEQVAIAFESMARPYLTLRRGASELRAILRSIIRRR